MNTIFDIWNFSIDDKLAVKQDDFRASIDKMIQECRKTPQSVIVIDTLPQEVQNC